MNTIVEQKREINNVVKQKREIKVTERKRDIDIFVGQRRHRDGKRERKNKVFKQKI